MLKLEIAETNAPVATPRKRTTREGRVTRALERCEDKCVWCSRELQLGDPELTIDHLIPRNSGGPNWAQNEMISCYDCNQRRGPIAASKFLKRCEQRGLKTNTKVISSYLLQLERELVKRGDHEKASKRLEEQLRSFGLIKTIPYKPNRVPLYCR